MTWHHFQKGDRKVACGKCSQGGRQRYIQPGEDYAITKNLLVRCETCAEKLNVPGPRLYVEAGLTTAVNLEPSQPFASLGKLAADFKVKQSGD